MFPWRRQEEKYGVECGAEGGSREDASREMLGEGRPAAGTQKLGRAQRARCAEVEAGDSLHHGGPRRVPGRWCEAEPAGGGGEGSEGPASAQAG